MAFREIGAAFVRIFVKKDELSAGLKQAGAEVKAEASKMQAEAAKTEDSFKQAGKTIKDSFGIGPIVGAVSGIAGGLTLAVVAGNKLVKALFDAGDVSAELRKNIDAAATAASNFRNNISPREGDQFLGGLNEQIRKVTEEMADLSDPNAPTFGKIVGAFTGRNSTLMQNLQDDLDRLIKEKAATEKAIADRAAAKAQEEADKKAAAEAAIAEAVARQQEENRLDDWRERERMALDLVNKEYDARMEREKELQRLREDSERRLQSLVEQFQGGNIAQDQRVIGTLDRIASNTGRVRR